MMNWKGILLGSAGLLVALAPGCATNDDSGHDHGYDTETARPPKTKWAVSMAAVDAEYGDASSYFLGLNPAEAGLPAEQMEAIAGQVKQAVKAGALAQNVPEAQAEALANAEAAKITGPIWDQTFAKNPDGTPHVDTGNDIAVIDRDGNHIDPPGYVNIIPMLKDTDPSEQVHIKEMLEDGDVLVYFHPEYQGPQSHKSMMERRSSHVAMHYEHVTGTGNTLVHHIDNPNSYGPRYNHSPRKHMPFHVFRFRPNAEKTHGDGFKIDEDMAQAYGKAARDWAFMTNDLSPFAGFFDLRLKTRADLDQFATNALNGQDIPKVYCSGLAFANLNLATNYPLNQNGLGDRFESFLGNSWNFSDAGESYTGADLQSDPSLEGINRLVFEPYGATDILNEWVKTYLGHLPLEAQMGIVRNDQLAQAIVSGMGQLEWSDAGNEEKSQRVEWEPASLENAKRWAQAYGLPAEATEGYLAADPDLQEAVSNMGLDTTGMTPMQVLQAAEAHLIDNRFVPPRIWLDEADKLESDMVYVGTVLNCELLVAVDGSDEDPCALGGNGATTFAEGAADTATYPHYRVPNGLDRTHRRFDATPGPELVGPSTYVDLRATHPNVDDFFFVVHTPQAYEGMPYADTAMMDYDHLCSATQEAGQSCAPPMVAAEGVANRAAGFMGIYLDPTDLVAEGHVDDATFRYTLSEICEFSEEDTTMLCPVVYRNDDGSYRFDYEWISRASHGWWAATMVDRGEDQTSLDLDECEQCTQGGGHFNQWVLNISAD